MKNALKLLFSRFRGPSPAASRSMDAYASLTGREQIDAPQEVLASSHFGDFYRARGRSELGPGFGRGNKKRSA